MKIIGITGGIGAGKTTVAKVFQHLGIPVFNADIEAKNCVYQPQVQSQIIALLGDQAYVNGLYNTTFVAEKVFKDKALLGELNTIIHPAVAKLFIGWTHTQHSNYVLKEAAILVETGGYKNLDGLIVVTAPQEQRVERVMLRNATTKTAVLQRMQAQISDEERLKYATHVVNNSNNTPILEQILGIHQQLLQL